MSLSNHSYPASLRQAAPRSRFAAGLAARPRTSSTAGSDVAAKVLVRRGFAPLPQEPDDACLTGVTRSLSRRLLALNLPGPGQKFEPVRAESKPRTAA